MLDIDHGIGTEVEGPTCKWLSAVIIEIEVVARACQAARIALFARSNRLRSSWLTGANQRLEWNPSSLQLG